MAEVSELKKAIEEQTAAFFKLRGHRSIAELEAHLEIVEATSKVIRLMTIPCQQCYGTGEKVIGWTTEGILTSNEKCISCNGRGVMVKDE